MCKFLEVSRSVVYYYLDKEESDGPKDQYSKGKDNIQLTSCRADDKNFGNLIIIIKE